MELSKHNIVSKLIDSNNYFIVNLLSQQADILSLEEFKAFQKGDIHDVDSWMVKGYLVDPEKEKQEYRKKYLEFLDDRDTDELQLFFVPTYACNFACSYCYQDEYEQKNKVVSKELIDAFFSYIDSEFYGRRKYITVFGGEPLLLGEKHKESIQYILNEAGKRQIDLAFVTNGYNLLEYIPELSTGRIREIQVTLDGVGDAHDKRRFLHGGGSSFEKIVEGINATLKAGLPVNLRMVLDKENISELQRLASFAIAQGWTSNPLFKTQIGRNYELHHCQSQQNKLYSRIELYQDIYKEIKDHPYILEFYKPAFSISKFLFEEGELPSALFDSCPGTKTEWAFDFNGKIYSCTATVGKEGEELGSFFPLVERKSDAIEEWEERDVLAIAECKDCNLQLACGGGCGAVAKNRTGEVCSTDCRPIKELLELGVSLYSNI